MRALLPLVLIGGIAACDAPTGTAFSAQTAEKVPVSANAGPGPKDVTPKVGGALFNQICLQTAPSFQQAPAQIAKHPFVQSALTGTYFHQTIDLSIKLGPKRCSLVMAGTSLGPQSVATFLDAAKAGTNTHFAKINKTDGRTYLQFVAGSK